MLTLLASLVLAPRGFTMVLGGDIMLNGVPVGRQPLAGVRSAFVTAGVAIANLEIPLTNATTRTPRKSAADIARRQQYVLKADPGHVKDLKRAGIDLVSLGNNHAMDYCLGGLRQMRNLLRGEGIEHTGAGENLDDSRRVAVYTAPDGTRVGLVSALAFKTPGGAYACSPSGESRPGVHWLAFNARIDQNSRTYLRLWFQRARQKCGILVVALHWGLEKRTVPEPYQVALGRACIEEGADVVWGHHPHVLQGAELYRGKPILYSMGNLVSPRPRRTGLVRLYFQDRRYRSFRFLPAEISGGRVGLTTSGSLEPLSRALQRRYPSTSGVPLF